MAAHEDKISKNRRKLFKALSTAPVVVTLSPGSALATQSAYQCLTKAVDPMPPVGYEFHLTDPGCTNDLCYVYQEKPYWTVSLGTKPIDPAWPQEVKDLVDATIVETQPGKFITLTGDNVSGLVTKDASDDLLIGPVTDPYIVVAGGNTGLFLLVIEPLGETENPPIDFVGVYPEFQPTGNLQGITGTCLTSIMPGSSGFTVANG